MEFSELKTIALGRVWPDEARSFTPWLFGHLDRLAKAVGIGLEARDTEVPVEGFSADILASTIDGRSVVIENQFGRSDHDHLGKTLTYLVGLDAQIVVWIAERFHDAHISAIHWLNDNTPEHVAFLAVRVEVVQIADSPFVPRFELQASPDGWIERIAEVRKNTGLSERGQFRKDYWEYYNRKYPEDCVPVGGTSNQWVYVEAADLNISLALVRDKIGLFLRGRRQESSDEARQRISMYEPGFRNQFPHWPEDEPIYDCAEWMRTNPQDRANWAKMADWHHEHIEIYKRILSGNA